MTEATTRSPRDIKFEPTKKKTRKSGLGDVPFKEQKQGDLPLPLIIIGDKKYKVQDMAKGGRVGLSLSLKLRPHFLIFALHLVPQILLHHQLYI